MNRQLKKLISANKVLRWNGCLLKMLVLLLDNFMMISLMKKSKKKMNLVMIMKYKNYYKINKKNKNLMIVAKYNQNLKNKNNYLI